MSVPVGSVITWGCYEEALGGFDQFVIVLKLFCLLRVLCVYGLVASFFCGFGKGGGFKVGIPDLFPLLRADGADGFRKKFYDVERIDTDLRVWEAAPGNFGEASAHVCAEVLYGAAFMRRELHKVVMEFMESCFVQNIDDGAAVDISDDTVVGFDIIPLSFAVVGAALSVELINAEGFREYCHGAKLNMVHGV